ncbi:MAG TPA: uracil-DNA glycosylase [Burkholderiaceae bacterium]|nr:uracil-DNA glycosylase [Burkholderiaceae bacterium]
MAWTERQRHMLAEMGIVVWAPQPGAADAAPVVDAAIEMVVKPQSSAPPVDGPHVAERPAVPPAERDLVATMDWPELRAAVDACRACRLCESRRRTVFGVGNERARLMVVGEAPGEQEDLKGEPFVGPAGKLLDNMLQALNLTRAPADPARQVYIANTLKCRPPGNRNPEPDEMVKCEPFLVRQIALVQPKVILAVGRFAVQALLRSTEPIGALRGRVHRYQGVPLVVTYHPAYLLRSPADKARAWDDLCLAGSLLDA